MVRYLTDLSMNDFFLTNAFGQNLLRDLPYFTSLVLMILIFQSDNLQCSKCTIYNVQFTIHNVQNVQVTTSCRYIWLID